MNKKFVFRLAAVMLLSAFAASCTQLHEMLFPTPNVPAEWSALLEEIRTFEDKLGFKETDNFKHAFEEKGEYSMCGYAPRHYLPYSYEDPAIRWVNSANEQDCRNGGEGMDVYFANVESVGEISTPVTSTMLEGKLDRFLYLVIHEDCHDQFELPYGIEEALCNLIGYKGMEVFSEQKFGAKAREDRAIRRYADTQSKITRATITHYLETERLYVRYARKEISQEALMQERARIFRRAERALAWKRGEMTNIGIASDMTYSRHYPLLERVHDALGRDLQRTVAFFRHVDQIKPLPAAVMKRHRIDSRTSVEFVRAYENAVAETIETALKDSAGKADPVRIK